MDAESGRLARGAVDERSLRHHLLFGIASPRVRRSAISLLVGLVAYGVLSSPSLRILKAQQFLPSYQALFESYRFLLTTGALIHGIAESVARMLEGYGLGAFVGGAIGAAMGASRRCEYLLDPLVQVVKFTPALAWLPLYMIWFGTGQASMVMLIATGVAVVTLTAAYHGVRDITDVYLKAARMLGVRPWLLVRRVIVPAALPQVFDGLRVAIGVSWAIIVAAELIGAPAGLGYLLVTAREYLNIPLVLVVVFHIGVLAFVMDLILLVIHRRVTRWMKRRALAGG